MMFSMTWFDEDGFPGEIALVRMTPSGKSVIMCAGNWDNYVDAMVRQGRWYKQTTEEES